MNTIQTEVLVIGGGATGTGVVRDLAMRGFKAVLVEKSDLATGTTGRYHGLLHSGGRYVVKDPQAARECIEENRILRQIMPQCIEDTGGFFVVTPWDDPGYAPRFVEGCHTAGIPVEEVLIPQALREEPLLNPKITHCYRVPDGAADSWLAADLNALSAKEYGSTILNYHKVNHLLRSGDKVVGALCQNLVDGEQVTIHANIVVNASGAWVGQITRTVDVPVSIVPGKGIMIAASRRILNTVVNRCKMPADGDILVPIHTVTVIGTTDIKVDDPDTYAIEPWEVQLMLAEGDKLVPGFRDMRMLRVWAGVRPLYQETRADETRDITRAYVLLDHEKRDGVSGLVTITSGKWTTYRKMAEVTVDLVCEKLGVQRPCRTHLEALPGNGSHGYHRMGGRLAQVERNHDYGKLVCECELATYDDVVTAIVQGEAKTIDDVRRDVRLGMGPCQGGFCTYRIAGLLHNLRNTSVQDTNIALRDFLQERWKGLLPILWGQQLRQERLNELIYSSLLNAHDLPGPQTSALSPELYLPAERGDSKVVDVGRTPDNDQKPGRDMAAPGGVGVPDVLVIGAGLAGLVAAWQAVGQGRRVRVISKGWGSLYWHTGCIDILGRDVCNENETVASPADILPGFIRDNPRHPYALAGLDMLSQVVDEIKELSRQAGYPLNGSLERNWQLPTALGTSRRTCLAPETMVAGDLNQPGKMLIVGFDQFSDFYPRLIADNLKEMGISADYVNLNLEPLGRQKFVTGRVLAEFFEGAGFRSLLANALETAISKTNPERIGFPAVLGLQDAIRVKDDLEAKLGRPVFEIPTLPPSIPGMRLHSMLVKAIERGGGRVLDGMQVISADIQDRIVRAVWSDAAARAKPHRARRFILATGGILGGGIRMESDGRLREVVLDLVLEDGNGGTERFARSFLSSTGHPVFSAGVKVNNQFRPVDESGGVILHNLYVAGATLAGCDPLQEQSLEGIALLSGYCVGRKDMNR
jgi:glycerol-3-phosphate dehydrogenase